MLVLSRALNEEIVITCPNGLTVVIKVEAINHYTIKLGVTAPNEVTVHRREVQDRISAHQPPVLE